MRFEKPQLNMNGCRWIKNLRGNKLEVDARPAKLNVISYLLSFFIRVYLCSSVFLFFIVAAQAQPDFVPRESEFPPPNAKGEYIAGELVQIDHVNRRGALRLLGDGVEDKYHAAPSHRFALLPYGTIRYHGAPAELRDVPIGTVLHGYFFLPPAGDKSIPPPTRGAQYVPKHTHALSLEDDVSFYGRQGQSWKISAVDLKAGKIKVTSSGTPAPDGLKGEKTFDVDASSRIWKGRQRGTLADLAVEEEVQVNLSWAANWIYGAFHCSDIWLDKESLALAAEQQRQIHLRYQRVRGLAALVDKVEHDEGGKGTITATFMGGMDTGLYEEFKVREGVRAAAAEATLRTWWQEHDNKSGPILEIKKSENPPPGSSGIRIRFTLDELLEGFRPGRIIRLCPHHWPRIKLPPEERVKDVNDR